MTSSKSAKSFHNEFVFPGLHTVSLCLQFWLRVQTVWITTWSFEGPVAHKMLGARPESADWQIVLILTREQTGLLRTRRFTPAHRPTCPQTHPHTRTQTYMQCLWLCEIDTQLSFTGALKRIMSLLAVTNEISTAVPSTAAGAEATFLFG